MKFRIIIGVFFIGILYANVASASTTDDILNILEEFRKRMCHPIQKFGLPALDPLVMSEASFATDGAILQNFSASVTNFTVIGLSDFVVNEIKFPSVGLGPKRIVFNITFPLTKIVSKYKANGLVDNSIIVAGDGDLIGKFVDVELSFTATVGLLPRLSIKKFKIDIRIGEINFDFGELIPDYKINRFFHSLINDIGINLLDVIWENKRESVEKPIEKKLNDKVSKYTLVEIIGIIAGGGGESEPIFGPNDPPADCKD